MGAVAVGMVDGVAVDDKNTHGARGGA